jgi:hypothetical protein
MPCNSNCTAGDTPAVLQARCTSAKRGGALLFLILLSAAFLSAQSATHDRDFWRAIANNKYAVPEHESADTLARELGGLLGSPDPELRDDLAYSILLRWVYRPNVLPLRRSSRSPTNGEPI